MSQVDDFLEKLLDGREVQWKKLGDILVKVAGAEKKVEKSKIAGEGRYPVYTQGASQKPDGYSDDDDSVIRDVPVILYGDHTNALKWIDHDFIAGADGVKLVKADAIDNKFLYYCLRNKIHEVPDGYARHFSKLRQLTIPIPPIEVQREIVRILDLYTELETELETELGTELGTRKKQFSYYRDQLFMLDQNEVDYLPMGHNAVGKFIRGGSLQKKDFTEKGVGCIHYGQIYTHYGTYANQTKSFVSEDFAKKARMAKPGDLVVATTSENDEDVCKAVAWLGEEEIAVSSDACFYTHSLNPKYVAYFFQTEQFQKQKRPFITGTKVRRVNADNLAKILIPIPSLEKQAHIASVIDKFDSLTNSISEGLPREIILRQKQYQYYRDLLYNFPKPEAMTE